MPNKRQRKKNLANATRGARSAWTATGPLRKIHSVFNVLSGQYFSAFAVGLQSYISGLMSFGFAEQEALSDELHNLGIILSVNLAMNTPSASGNLAASTYHDVIPGGTDTQTLRIMQPAEAHHNLHVYLPYVAQGQRPHRPPIEPIIEWVQHTNGLSCGRYSSDKAGVPDG